MSGLEIAPRTRGKIAAVGTKGDRAEHDCGVVEPARAEQLNRQVEAYFVYLRRQQMRPDENVHDVFGQGLAQVARTALAHAA